MKVFGFALVVLGILALVYGGISYNRHRTIVEVGPFKATATEQKNVPMSPIFGGIALLGGILLLAARRKPLRLNQVHPYEGDGTTVAVRTKGTS